MSRIRLLVSYALRDASKSKVVLALIITSLSVAFVAVFVSASIFAGFEKILFQGVIDSSGHIVVSPGADDDEVSIKNAEDVASEIADLDNVRAASVRSQAIAGVHYKDRHVSPYTTVGVDVDGERAVTRLHKQVIEGAYLGSDDTDVVVIGLQLANALVGEEFDTDRVEVGETVIVNMVNGASKEYTVGGIVDAKTFIPNWTLFFPKNELDAQTSLQKDSLIVVSLENPGDIEETREVIQEMYPTLTVSTWRERAGFIDDILEVVSFITVSINRLLIISVFVIMCVIVFINVFQKRRQIGIMKSMGATNAFIIGIYMLETFIYTAFSYGLGFVIFYLLYLQSAANPITLPIGDFNLEFQGESILLSSLVLLTAAVAGSFVPAYIAARTRIVDVIRSNI